LVISESTALKYERLDPDVRLMLKVRDDDAAAFEELMRRYQSRLITILQHIVGRRDQAEDLVQDVFLRVYRARKRYVPGAKFSTWLFTIANNVARNALRSSARRHEINLGPTAGNESSALTLEQLAMAASGQMPTRQFDRNEMADIVRLAVTSLNERQQMAVLLSKFEEMSYADISQVMDLSPQAIKSLLSRARGKLRKILEPYLSHQQVPEDNQP